MKTKIKTNSLDFVDPILNKKIKLKIIESNSDELKITVNLPQENGSFKGVSFKENIKLAKLKNGYWVKEVHAKFGSGAKKLFGVNEIHEFSPLESRDIRIIAAVEKLTSNKVSFTTKNLHI